MPPMSSRRRPWRRFPAKADVPTLFARMLDVLKRMHDQNASWGPLFIAHPGDVARHYFRTPRKAA